MITNTTDPNAGSQAVDHFKRIDTNRLHPYFFELLKQLMANCAARGVIYYATEGERIWATQAAYYAKGRDATGKVVKRSEVVTNAPPGLSMHHYFIACDFVRDLDLYTPGIQPGWDKTDFDVLAEEAVKLGLDAGRYWKGIVDSPHIQCNLALLNITSVTTLKSLYEKRGEAGIWEFLNSKLVAGVA